MLFENFKRFIQNHELIQEKDRILIGFSGGPDSMALYDCLRRYQELYIQLKIKIALIHICYRKKGGASLPEKNWIIELAKKDKVRLYMKSVASLESSIQASYRTIRFNFYRKIFKKKSYDKLFLGHHLDDQIETFFFRIISRSYYLKGLKGIQFLSKDWGFPIIRPFLEEEKKTILNYLEKRTLFFLKDLSNEKMYYSRNKIRLGILPNVDMFFPQYKKNILSWLSKFTELEQDLELRLAKVFKKSIIYESKDEIYFKYFNFLKYSDFLKKEILYALIKRLNVDPKKLKNIQIIMLLQSFKKYSKKKIFYKNLIQTKNFSITIESGFLVFSRSSTIQDSPYKNLDIPLNSFPEKKICKFLFEKGRRKSLFLEIKNISLKRKFLLKEKLKNLKGVLLSIPRSEEKISINPVDDRNRLMLSNALSSFFLKILKDQKIPKEKFKKCLSISTTQGEILGILAYYPIQYKRVFRKELENHIEDHYNLLIKWVWD